MSQKQKAGRPSKLTESQRSEIERRLANGESGRSLALEFNIGETTMRRNFAARVPKIKSIANRLASVENDMAELPVSAQATIRGLADNMKATCANLAAVTALNTRTAHRLAKMADKSMDKLEDPEATLENREVEVLNLAAYGSLSHNLSRAGVSLVTAAHRPESDEQASATSTADAKERLKRMLGL